MHYLKNLFVLLTLVLYGCGGGGDPAQDPSKNPIVVAGSLINSSTSVNNVQIPMYGNAWSETIENRIGHLDSWNQNYDLTIIEPSERPKKSGNISDSEVAETSVIVNIPVDGEVNFYFKVDSEENYDYLIFYIDGIVQGGASGSIPWTLTAFPITAGIHTLRWEYIKDESNSYGEDSAWIDQVKIPTSTAMQMGGAIIGTPLNLTTTVSTLAGSAGVSGFNDDIGTTALFSLPSRITTDGTNLYVADSDNYKIRQIVIATGEVTTLAGSGTPGSSDGIGALAEFTYPEGITFFEGNLYVTDFRVIRKIVIATGEVTTFAGSGIEGSANGFGVTAEFSRPIGITNDGISLYVTDFKNEQIRKIVITNAEVSTFAGVGGCALTIGPPDDGWGTYVELCNPWGITTDGTYLYVTEQRTNRIRKINIATQQVTTIAGTGYVGSDDNALLGTQASFDGPAGITTDGTYLYVADSGNHNIRKVDIATTAVSTLVGTGVAGSVNGVGATASFNSPRGITTDGSSLYILDYGSHIIRKIQ